MASLLTGEKINEFFVQVRTTDLEGPKEEKRAAPTVICRPSSKNVGLSTFVTIANKL
jgi:hypothetical protein